MPQKNLSVICLLFSVLASAAVISPNTLIRLPGMQKLPDINGKIEAGEWNHASSSFGGVSNVTTLMSKRLVTWYFGYDQTNLYLACDSEAPKLPQQLTAEDTVTLALLPPGAETVRLFHVNPNGNGNLPEGSFTASSILTELDRGIILPHWHLEISIPLAACGVTTLLPGQTWGLQITREFQNAAETAFWHYPAQAGQMGTFIPDPAAPIIGFDGFGHMLWNQTSNYYMKFRAENLSGREMLITPDCLMVASALSYATLNPQDTSSFKEGKVTFPVAQHTQTLKAGELRPLEQVIWAQFPGTVRTLIGKVTSEKEDVVFFYRSFSWNLSEPRNVRWKNPGLPKLDSAFYPSFGNKLLVRMTGVSDRRSVETAENIGEKAPEGFQNVTVTVKNLHNQPVHTFSHLENSRNFQQECLLGELPLGDYKVELQAERNDGQIFTDLRTFSVRKFDWQNNTLGMDRVIIPPFVPLKTDAGKQEVHALQTGYRIANGFWDAVYVKGENILAAPVELLIDGESFTPVSTRLVSAEADRVLYESLIRYKNLDIKVTHDYDYDGFCKTTLAFQPQGLVKLRSLVLVMPVKSEIARFFNMFIHPRNKGESYEIPAGNGEVWNSFQATQKSRKPGAWTPYCWVGGVYQGFCWIADSYRHYQLDADKPCQRLERTADALAFKLDIVNQFTVWNASSPFEIVMGFQPTPVKPMAEGYRKMGSIMYDEGWYPRSCQVFSRYGGVDLRTNVFNPLQGDYSFFDYLVSIMDIPPEKRDRTKFNRNRDEYLQKHVEEYTRRNLGTEKSLRDNLDWHFSRTTGKLLLYTDPLGISCFWPEDEMYKAEWSAWTFPVEEPFYQEYLSRLPKSRIDKQIHDEWRAVRRGVDGVNFDCFGQGGGFNTENGVAWYDEKGQIHSNCELFAWRQIVRRTAIMVHVEGKHLYGVPWVDVHSTDGMVVPVCSFASTLTTTEMGGRRGEYQDRFLESQFLSDILGIHAGAVSFPIVSCESKKNELDSLLAVMFAYGFMNITDQGVPLSKNTYFRDAVNIVFDFGFGDPGVEIFPYWGEQTPPVTHDAKDIRMTVARRPDGKTLLMIGNLGEKTQVRFDLTKLGYPNSRLSNAETKQVLATPEISVERRSYALVMIEKVNQ